MKKIGLSIISLLMVFVLVGCGSKDKPETIEQTIDPTLGTREVTESISNSNNTVEYTFNTEEIKVVASMKYNNNFQYEEGKIKKGGYTVHIEFVENDLEVYDDYKKLDGYDRLTIDGKEAIKTISDVMETTMVRINDHAILYIYGTTDGTIINTEMTQDSDYKDVIRNIKINVTNK